MRYQATTRAALGGAAALALACAHPHGTGARDAGVMDGVERLRAATARFADLDSAVAAGYTRAAPRCIAHGEDGAMGFHHVNRAYLDERIEVERPEILVYERLPDGRYVMNGVEYVVPYASWPRDSVPPRVFGLELKRADNLELWYLHVWTVKANPAGLFADWNPAVHCTAG